MLILEIPDSELFDEKKQEFFEQKGRVLRLEHSLVSLAKWESEWLKPFLVKDDKTIKETISYIRFMTMTQNVDPDVYKLIDRSIIAKISAYIEHPMTATTFPRKEKRLTSREIITAEIIYYWMILFNIPLESQKWHLNRLLTLINVCNVKNQPGKKMSRKEMFSRNRSLNDARRKQLNTKG